MHLIFCVFQLDDIYNFFITDSHLHVVNCLYLQTLCAIFYGVGSVTEHYFTELVCFFSSTVSICSCLFIVFLLLSEFYSFINTEM